MNYNFPIIIEKSEEGYYAECPLVQGTYAEGDTEEQVIFNLKDVLKLILEDMKARGNVFDFSARRVPSITVSSLSFSF